MRRKNLNGVVTGILVFTTLLSGLTACGKEEKLFQYKLKIGNTSDSAISMPLNQISEQAGYFDEYNLDVQYENLTETGSFESLSAGKVDALYVEVITPISYGVQGADITIFGGNITGGMIAVAREEDADELSDISNWKGRSIGAIQYSRTEVLARHVLKDTYGYEVGTDIDIVNVEDYATVQLGVVKGNIDVGFIPSNYAESSVDSGLVVLFPLTYLEEDYVCCRQTAYGKSLEENRDAYVALLKAQIKAYKAYNENTAETVSLLAENSGETEEYIEDYVYNAETNGNRRYNPDPNYNGVLAVYDTMVDVDYVSADRPLYDFFDISVYADALKEIIEENPEDSFYRDMWDYFLEHDNQYPEFNDIYGDYL